MQSRRRGSQSGTFKWVLLSVWLSWFSGLALFFAYRLAWINLYVPNDGSQAPASVSAWEFGILLMQTGVLGAVTGALAAIASVICYFFISDNR